MRIFEEYPRFKFVINEDVFLLLGGVRIAPLQLGQPERTTIDARKKGEDAPPSCLVPIHS
jgi:hypothetical protein